LETDKVYGEKLNASVSDPLRPSEPYATSKCCQQFIAESYIQTYGMNIVIPHGCNAFGYDPYSNRIFPNTIRKCLKGESPIIYRNDLSRREYIYIEDLVYALTELVKRNLIGSYNIATGWFYNQEEVVKSVLKFFPGIEPKYVDGKLPYQIQLQNMKMYLGGWDWQPRWSWEEAIKETIDKFKLYRSDFA
jgi:dTDP-D-glucose 4,6-dehydratase